MRYPVLLQPIRRRLPVLISVLLAVAIGVLSWAAYRQLEQALRDAGIARTQSAAERLATALAESSRRVQSDATRLASDSVVEHAARFRSAGASSRTKELFASRLAATPQIVRIELVDASGAVLVSADRRDNALWADRLAASPDTSGRSWVGPISAIGDSAYYAVGARMRDDGTTLGHVIQYRRLSSGQSIQLIADFIGSDATLLIGNAAGGRWTDFSSATTIDTDTVIPGATLAYTDETGERRVGVAAAIQGTPWLALVTLPEGAALAPAQAYLRGTIGLALLVIALGTVGAWVISRQITSPLAEVSAAAEGISRGDYSRRVQTTHDADELGRLGASFNTMAQQVQEATDTLGQRVAERTHELNHTLEQLKDAQAALVRRERLAVLGQLAGSVGHELRNPLGVMTNALYYLAVVLKDAPASVQEYLGILRTQIGMSEKIVGDLLDYARVKPPRREAVDLAHLAAEELERAAAPSGMRIETEFPPDLPRVVIDRQQVGQVVFNLITNAIQAMPNGGTLTLRGTNHNGNGVRFEVADTGVGIARADLEKIFEPLFTTKARGIGLGLSVSRSLAQANGGTISVQSVEGQGTVFSVFLPTSVPADT